MEVYYNSVMTEKDECHNACNLLKDLINNKSLHLISHFLEVLPHEDLTSHLPTFTNLSYLRVFRPCRGKQLLSVLRLMPNLEYLVCDKVYALSEEDLTSHIREMPPSCFQSRIEEFQINEFDGSKGDLWMIHFLFTNVVGFEISDIIDTRNMFSDPVKIIRLRSHSSNPRRPLSLQDLLSPLVL